MTKELTMKYYLSALLLITAQMTSADPYAGMSPEEKGLAIANAADERTNGFIDSSANMRMILTKSLMNHEF